MKRVALLGPGTFSEESARYFMKDQDIEYVPYKLISDVFISTASGETDYSVIPIENTIEGSVSLHLDWLVHEVDLPIQAEWVYPIDMCLIGASSLAQEKEFDVTKLAKVVSHPVAIAQCRQFLRDYLAHAEIEQVSSTAEGARLVGQWNDPQVAAIGTLQAAGLYHLPVLASQIQDHQENCTRFALIGKEPLKAYRSLKGIVKTTILITLPEDYPGALHQVLSAFSWRRINLTRIESRPTKKKLGNYYFFIDLEGSAESVLIASAFQEIEAIGCQVRILGSYFSYTIET